MPAMPRISPPHGGEGHVVEHLDAFLVLDGQVLDLQALGLVLVQRTVNVQGNGPADHHVGQLTAARR